MPNISNTTTYHPVIVFRHGRAKEIGESYLGEEVINAHLLPTAHVNVKKISLKVSEFLLNNSAESSYAIDEPIKVKGFVSPIIRCQETAQIFENSISKKISITWQTEASLTEFISYGRPNELAELVARVRDFYQFVLLPEAQRSPVVICTHSAVITTLSCLHNNQDLTREQISNSNYSFEQFCLLSFNSSSLSNKQSANQRTQSFSIET